MKNFSKTKTRKQSFNLKDFFLQMKQSGLLEEVVINNKTYWVIKPVEEQNV